MIEFAKLSINELNLLREEYVDDINCLCTADFRDRFKKEFNVLRAAKLTELGKEILQIEEEVVKRLVG